MAQASHPTEFYRAVIKTEVVLGKIFVVVFKWIGMLVCDNTLTFAFQTQQQCAFQLTGRTAEEAVASLFAARNIFSSSVPFLSEALQYQLSHHHSTAATLPSAPPPNNMRTSFELDTSHEYNAWKLTRDMSKCLSYVNRLLHGLYINIQWKEGSTGLSNFHVFQEISHKQQVTQHL